jgi:biotin carboxyl carrier protein
MSMPIPTSFRSRQLALACAALLALSACERAGETPPETASEMTWARAALERNPNLDVLAVDIESGVFTVRDRRTGEVQAIKAAELAAAPVTQLSTTPMPRSASPEPAQAGGEATAAANEAVEAATPGELVAQAPKPPLAYTVERRGDQVRVSAPGVSIVSADSRPAPTARSEAATGDPIICEGQRMLQLNDRRIVVDGDAITARNGCELHITNSRIIASGTGVVVRDATVHITNSYVEGATASCDAGPGAKIYLRAATLSGVMRRDALAKIQELPGG